MVTGVTRNYTVALNDVRQVLDPRAQQLPVGVTLILSRGRFILVADTTVHEMPTAEELAEITVQMAGVARRLGHRAAGGAACVFNLRFPARGALRAHHRSGGNLGQAQGSISSMTAEMAADIALDREKMAPLSVLPAV
jgi:malate dehydrogenase (oxaloacetate-decarboxylating)(NADP+)